MATHVTSMALEVVVGSNIRRKRLLKGISQRKLALEVGIAVVQLGRIEDGAASATIGVVSRIADALECAIADLFETTGGSMPASPPRVGHASGSQSAYPSADGAGADHRDEADAARDNGQPRSEGGESNPQPPRNDLQSGISGFYNAAAEKMIADIIAHAGGVRRLSVVDRRKIKRARAWAQAREIDHR